MAVSVVYKLISLQMAGSIHIIYKHALIYINQMLALLEKLMYFFFLIFVLANVIKPIAICNCYLEGCVDKQAQRLKFELAIVIILYE